METVNGTKIDPSDLVTFKEFMLTNSVQKVLKKHVDIVSYDTDRYEVLGKKNGMLMMDERDSVEF
jgi:hypothetical protein